MNNSDKEFLVQKIRTQYTEKEHTNLDELKELDARLKRPANIFAYIFGSIGSLVMGTGMCFSMNVIEAGKYFGITIGENMMVPGIIIGLIGILMVCINYPIYKNILASRRKKYADEIFKLSEKIMSDK